MFIYAFTNRSKEDYGDIGAFSSLNANNPDFDRSQHIANFLDPKDSMSMKYWERSHEFYINPDIEQAKEDALKKQMASKVDSKVDSKEASK